MKFALCPTECALCFVRTIALQFDGSPSSVSIEWTRVEPQLWPFFCLMLVLIFLILNILKYMKVYEGIWRYTAVYDVYEGI